MKGCRQNNEIPMPFVVQMEHFIISPYSDLLEVRPKTRMSTGV